MFTLFRPYVRVPKISNPKIIDNRITHHGSSKCGCFDMMLYMKLCDSFIVALRYKKNDKRYYYTLHYSQSYPFKSFSFTASIFVSITKNSNGSDKISFIS